MTFKCVKKIKGATGKNAVENGMHNQGLIQTETNNAEMAWIIFVHTYPSLHRKPKIYSLVWAKLSIQNHKLSFGYNRFASPNAGFYAQEEEVEMSLSSDSLRQWLRWGMEAKQSKSKR